MATAGPMACDIASSKKLIVAAIDLGTTYTGFAFSFQSDPTKIFTSKWSRESIRSETEKAPTCVLLSPEKEFVAFGYDAEEKLIEMIEDERKYEQNKKQGRTTVLTKPNPKDYYYFERFKMMLYQTKKLRQDTTIVDKYGKELPAFDVFATVLHHMKDNILEDLCKQSVGIQEDEILWVLTVPAIWSDPAKQFMREAAIEAGLGKDVKLVLEPEAASLYCNQQRLCRIVKFNGSSEAETFPEGQKYIIADLGGGTADISVHEILKDRNLKEIHRADGDALGSFMVNQEFLSFLEKVLGKRVFERLKRDYTDKLVDICAAFETKKWTFKPEAPRPINMKFPWAIVSEIIETINKELNKATDNNDKSKIVEEKDKSQTGPGFSPIEESERDSQCVKNDDSPSTDCTLDPDEKERKDQLKVDECKLESQTNESNEELGAQGPIDAALVEEGNRNSQDGFHSEGLKTTEHIEELLIRKEDQSTKEPKITTCPREDSIEIKITKACEVYGKASVKRTEDKIIIDFNRMKDFFKTSAEGIVAFIKNIRENEKLGEINILLMVGGFSESKYLVEFIGNHVPGIRIIVPYNPSLAVLKGAVIAGHNPKAITERIA